jgi:hypothetical protein
LGSHFGISVGANKTEFNLKSLNIGMDRRIAQDKTIFAFFAHGLGSHFGISVFHWILFLWILFLWILSICLFYNDSKVFINTPSAVADYQLTFEATDFEAPSGIAYRVKVQATFIQRFFTGDIMSTETVDKTITVTVADLDDEAPTNIQISDTDLPANSPVGTLVGTLSATDVDTAFFTTIVKFLSILRVPSLAVMVTTLLLPTVLKARLVLSSLPLAIPEALTR